MRTALLVLCVLAGCRACEKDEVVPPAPVVVEPPTPDHPTQDEDKILESVTLEGFDHEGEPEIRRMKDGTMWVVFNFMPPSWDENAESKWEHFERDLTRAAGVEVVRDDREFFLIKHPKPDTADRIRKFLERYRKH
jgi:hypothetical protein